MVHIKNTFLKSVTLVHFAFIALQVKPCARTQQDATR